MKLAQHIVAGLAALGLATGIVIGVTGTAYADTLPATSPDEPTVAMTITNHTDQPDILIFSFRAGPSGSTPPACTSPPAQPRSSLRSHRTLRSSARPANTALDKAA